MILFNKLLVLDSAVLDLMHQESRRILTLKREKGSKNQMGSVAGIAEITKNAFGKNK